MKSPLSTLQAADTSLNPPVRLSLHERFEFQAKRTPDAVAVSQGTATLTYRELNERANQIAHLLRSRGVEPEQPVALYLDRTPAMVTAILGVLKAGAPYVPIDLSYPKDRAQFMMEDTGARVLITEERLKASVPSSTAEVLALDACGEELSKQPVTNPLTNITDENAAYIIYTSGSTGKPKGVVVTHYNVTRLLHQTAHWYGFNAQDVWPLFHSYAFDVSVWELWASLLNGGRLVVVPYMTTRSPAEFYHLLADEKITVLNQTPSAFRQLIWAEVNSSQKLELSLRYVICAGEALELQSLKPWFDLHGDEQPQVVNMYGITETTVHSTFRVIRKTDLESGAGSVIGVPIPDLQIYLVDEDLKPVPKGTPGEICVGGAGVARGYLNRPDLNEKRFLPDPYSDDPNARIYRSGDLAQYGPSGELEYLGRMDHQVKIRGFRVELGEIESALNRQASVQESVVIARDSSAGDKRLVAYLVPRSGAIDVSELRAYLGQTLPEYMVPAQYVSLPRLPLTTNGKVDRQALPVPDTTRPNLKSDYVAPRNGTEETLAKIWAEVLELQQVGVADNLFELGGDSIRGIRILAKAQQALSVQLTVENLFQHPTVAELAACASGLQKQEQAAVAGPFGLVSPEDRGRIPDGVEDAYPIAALQLGMFYRNELNPASAIYHDVFSYRVRCRFDEAKLQQVLDSLLARHPLLRTSFDLAAFSRPLQLVHKHVAAPLTSEDLRGLPRDQQTRRLTCWIESEKRRPFNRARPPLVRFHVQCLADEAFQFIISFHHCCLDGWSLAAVVTEVFQEYASLLDGKSAKLTAPHAFYRDFVALEGAAAEDPVHREFWSKQLAGASFAPLPRWPAAGCTGGLEQVRGPEKHVSAEVLKGLRSLAQQAGVPLKTVLLAAHLRVMSLHCGTEDVLTGLISNGRPERADGDRIVGLFLNAVPLRQRLEAGSWLDLVQATFQSEKAVMPYRRFPLAEAHKLSNSGRLFETAFDFVHFHVYNSLQGRQDIDLAEGHYFEANDMTTYTTFMLSADSSSLEIHIDYDPNELGREQVSRLTDHYLAVLRAMATQPAQRYEHFSALREDERKLQLVEWNDTAEDYPSNSTIHELFEERARQNPDAVAVVCGQERLTYGELNHLADAIAGHLRSAGARPGKTVGIYLERSARMLAAVLGVLKSGAAYLPLDPAYPADRLEFMAADSGTEVVVTESAIAGRTPRSIKHNILVDDLRPAPGREMERSQGAASRSRDLAYVIYTSGSTGKPKGVQIEHRSVVNLLLSAAKKTNFTERENLLAITTLSFDIAGLELLMPLLTGATVTIAGSAAVSDPEALARLISNSQATFMQATPATWRMLIEAGWSGARSLRVVSGGEALKPELASELLSRVAEVWNFYGPTETTIWSTACRVLPGESVTIGWPLANTKTYILNSQHELMPVGAIGELYIGGDGVARGYWNRPDLTSERFIENPFTHKAGDRLYRTGDLARFLPDGRIECLGRMDHQVKIRGFRIEPGEVETVLKQYHAIADAVVTAREDSFGEKKLVGYVTSRNGPPNLAELKDFARGRLPAHMVPGQLVLLETMPLTPNGKVDHRQLPPPEAAGQQQARQVPPADSDEQALALIWQEVLGVKSIGTNDNVFDLGADSLSATRAYARINRKFAVQISLQDVFQHPTIQALKPLLKASQGNPSRVVSPIKAVPRII